MALDATIAFTVSDSCLIMNSFEPLHHTYTHTHIHVPYIIHFVQALDFVHQNSECFPFHSLLLFGLEFLVNTSVTNQNFLVVSNRF